MRAGSWVEVPGNRPALSFDGGETVVQFDPISGDTHFLSMLPALVLEQMTHQPLTFDQLVHRLADGAITDLDDEAMAAIAKTLDFLEGAELVEFHPPEID